MQPDPKQGPAYAWSLRSLLATAAGGNLGCLTYFLADRLASEVEAVLIGTVFLLVLVALFCLVKLHAAVEQESVLSLEERARFRRNILFTGPAAALEIFLGLRRNRSGGMDW